MGRDPQNPVFHLVPISNTRSVRNGPSVSFGTSPETVKLPVSTGNFNTMLNIESNVKTLKVETLVAIYWNDRSGRYRCRVDATRAS